MATIWPFAPVGSVSERLMWNTDVLQARSSEQRIAMRRVPIRSLNLRHVLSELNTSRAIQIVRNEDANGFLVPHWGQLVNVGAVGIGSDTVIAADFTGTELQAGSEAIIWQSLDNYEQVTVTQKSDISITVDSVIGTYTDAIVMPLLDASLPSGVSVDRDASIWRDVSANFQINTNVDASALGKVLIYIALDTSLSMDTDVGGGITRLDNAKSALVDTLDYLLQTAKEFGADIDVMVVGWDSGKVSQTETSIDATKTASLQSFINGLTTTSGTDFRKGVEDAPVFFASAEYNDGVVIFITDGDPSILPKADNAQDARDILDTVATPISTYGINIDLVDTTYTAIVDDTDADGVPVVAGNDPTALLDAITAAIYPVYYSSQYLGMDVVDDACVVAGGSFSESISRQLQGFDNGAAVPYYLDLRTLLDMTFQVRWQTQDHGDLYQIIKFIHSRKGRQKAFWISTRSSDLAIAENISGTTVTVLDITRTDVPFHIEIVASGVSYFREVSAISQNSEGYFDLTIDSSLTLSAVNVSRISFLLCSRFNSDSIEVSHEPTVASISIPCIEIPEP